MEILFNPAIAFMDRLRYPLTFGMIFAIVFVPLITLSYLLISKVNDKSLSWDMNGRGWLTSNSCAPCSRTCNCTGA